MNKKIDSLRIRISELDHRIQNVMSLRLITGLASFILFFSLGLWGLYWSNTLLFVSSLSAFIYFVKKMKNFKRFKRKHELLLSFFERQLQKEYGLFVGDHFHLSGLQPDQEILCNDLNLFGPKSLFSLLNECTTSKGKSILGHWLVDSRWNLKQLLDRQKVIAALASKTQLLVRFHIESQLHAPQIEIGELQEDMQSPITSVGFSKMLKIHLILMPIVWGVVLASLVGWVHISPLIPFIFYLLFSLATRGAIENSFSKAQNLAFQLQNLLPMFLHVEKKFSSTSLKDHFPQVLESKPSTQLKQLNKYTSLLSIQGHPMVHFVVNSLVPWDYILSDFIERWRSRFSPQYQKVVDELIHFEALMSCAFFCRYSTSQFPELEENPQLNFEKAFHPLIDRNKVVANSFTVPQKSRLILITGSNMSGKSTFLRTIGINQVLALMGCPVFAKSFKTFVAPVKSCLKVSDSIDEGLSSFYYEVKQVRRILEAARDNRPFIYLIDEIFRGTNNRERLIGSQHVIKELVTHKNTLGFVSTHDLELTKMKDEISQLANWHFKDNVKDHKLVFDYLIHEGPCPTTNALKILEQEGVIT